NGRHRRLRCERRHDFSSLTCTDTRIEPAATAAVRRRIKPSRGFVRCPPCPKSRRAGRHLAVSALWREPTFLLYGRYGTLDRVTGSVCLDVGRPDHLAPFLGFIGDEFPERGRCHRHRVNTQAVKPRLYEGISRNGVDLLVELVDHLSGRVLRRTDP